MTEDHKVQEKAAEAARLAAAEASEAEAKQQRAREEAARLVAAKAAEAVGSGGGLGWWDARRREAQASSLSSWFLEVKPRTLYQRFYHQVTSKLFMQ